MKKTYGVCRTSLGGRPEFDYSPADAGAAQPTGSSSRSGGLHWNSTTCSSSVPTVSTAPLRRSEDVTTMTKTLYIINSETAGVLLDIILFL